MFFFFVWISHDCHILNALQQLGYLREKAKALTNMAAAVPYRMPGDTNSRLVQMEILMHWPQFLMLKTLNSFLIYE